MPLILQADTAHAIQLAIAPAFVLAAIGSTLTVLTNRLGRIDDHSEKLRGGMKEAGVSLSAADGAVLAKLDTRAKLIHVSISSAVACGLLICAMVMATFTGDEFGLAADRVIALLFGGAMASLGVTYAVFLVEIYLGAHMLKPDRPLSAN
jgi:hypothetical protein